jgi:hypothetical protein
MGEAKRKRLSGCRCGSGRPANACCLTSGVWYKRPEIVRLHNTGMQGSNPSCYLRTTSACCTKVSGEHLISETVLSVLAEKRVELSGLPWLGGQKKILGFKALTANCLCKTHNSALSPIDTVGGRFFAAIQSCGTSLTGPPHNFLFSGHDVERWMLRTIAALGASKNFAIDGAQIDSAFVERLRLAELLEDPMRWRSPLGMYLMHGVGYQFAWRENLQLSPIVRRGSDEIVGVIVDIQGFQIGVLADDHDIRGTGLDRAVYRPCSLAFKMGHLTHTIQICWDDALPHMDVTITWQPPP